MSRTPLPPSDDDLDRLLASKLKRTSPELELRWRELRARLADSPHAQRSLRFPRWLLWPGVATAGLAAVALALVSRNSPPSAAPDPEAFSELFALDAALGPATPLLDRETRDAVIHLPAQKSP